jgi:cytoskeletal protein RodZ
MKPSEAAKSAPPSTRPSKSAAAPRVNRTLQWLLLLTVLACLGALLWPADAQVSTAVARTATEKASSASSQATGLIQGAVSAPPSEAVATVPVVLKSQQLDAASFDPFLGQPVAKASVAANASTAPTAQATQPEATAAAEAVAQRSPPPALNTRFLGRMIDPQGQLSVYLTDTDNAVAAVPGTRLSDGWVVDSIGDATLRFSHPPTGSRAQLDIPPPQ